ncbi:hypothetical protein LPB136_05075 [Tenacibaculum todarodis]|uniref:Peptidase E n=1 Tax=Tenacibaculum todarodis TaxID=1850252 RepID=A0A1L3JI02_9FLAO|nr:DUF6702 family protein [Tenacibaculum todarodis]APG64771.1 hypothetical protein LPB136_05075 [Tenacibaculum todarodis]
MKKIITLFVLLPLLSFSAHKYYLSLTQIEFNKEAQSVQIITNVFMDDIELAINKDYTVDLQLTTEKEPKNVDEYFEKYVTKHLKIKIDNIDKPFTFIGKEYDGDIVYFYLEIENITAVATLEINNTILVKHFPDQQNLIKAKANGKNISKMLTKKNDKGLLKF